MAEAGWLDALRVRGATVSDIDGHVAAVHFGDAASEYRALRDQAALVDLPWLDRLVVVGGDRVDFLQGMLSNDVKKLAVGGGCPALLLSEQGKVIADLVVLAGVDEMLLDGVGSGLVAAQAALERFIVADDVEIARPADAMRTFALVGPTAAAVLARLGVAMPAVSYAHARVETAGVPWHVVHVPAPGAGGVLCHVAADAAAGWWERCLQVGECQPAGFEAFEALRIESGVPRHGRDVTGDTLALEAPYDAAVSFRKGCYLGQEVMERVTARGHVNRKLVGIEIAGDAVPPAGTRLFAEDRDVGWLTSATRSWRPARVVALAYVRREQLAPGTTLAYGAAGGPSATVRALPF